MKLLTLYKSGFLFENSSVLKEADDNHPSSLYHSPNLIDFIKSRPDINSKLKQRYGGYYLGMIDGIDAYYMHQHPKNPFKDIKDPLKYLNAYIGSKEEKSDIQQMYDMGMQDYPNDTPPIPNLPKIKLEMVT